MEDLIKETKHPITGKWYNCWWIYNKGKYVVNFPLTGEIFNEEDFKWETKE